jgi:hypothetical protein
MVVTGFNQSRGYDTYRCRALVCIIVGTLSVYIMHISNYFIVDIMPIANANL